MPNPTYGWIFNELRLAKRVDQWCLSAVAARRGVPCSTFVSWAHRAGMRRPGSVLRSLRLAEALKYLQHPLPMAEAADAMGYSSPQALGRAFRVLIGRDWRIDVGLVERSHA